MTYVAPTYDDFSDTDLIEYHAARIAELRIKSRGVKRTSKYGQALTRELMVEANLIDCEAPHAKQAIITRAIELANADVCCVCYGHGAAPAWHPGMGGDVLICDDCWDS